MDQAQKTESPDAVWSCCGYIDAIESGRIYGWAWNPAQPEQHLTVDVFHCGQLIDSVVANRFRSDLQELGIGDGRHAFVFDLPPDRRAANPAEFSLSFHRSSVPLVRGAQIAVEPPARSAGPEADGTAEGSPVMAALQHRIEQIEAGFAKVLKLTAALHRQQTAAREDAPNRAHEEAIRGLQGELAQIRDLLANLIRSVEANDVFLVRFDAQLKQAARRADLEDLRRRVARAPGRGRSLILALVGGALAGALAGGPAGGSADRLASVLDPIAPYLERLYAWLL